MKASGTVRRAGMWVLCLGFSLATPGAPAEPPRGSAGEFISWLLEDDRQLTAIPFPEVVTAATGRQVLPIDPEEETDRQLLDRISLALDEVMRRVNQPDHLLIGFAHDGRQGNQWRFLSWQIVDLSISASG